MCIDIDKIKSVLNQYKLDVFKSKQKPENIDKDTNAESIIKDLRLTLDRIDNGKLPQELDKLIPPFIKLWSERK